MRTRPTHGCELTCEARAGSGPQKLAPTGAAGFDSEQFRSTPRTCWPFCGRLGCARRPSVWGQSAAGGHSRARRVPHAPTSRRREFMLLLGRPRQLRGRSRRAAQQPDRVRRVGILMGIADDFEGQARIAVFRQTLQALGWSEGRNVQFIYRWSGGNIAHARQFAKELVDLRSDVILTNSTPVTVAVKETTRTPPPFFCRSATRSPPASCKAWRDQAAVLPASQILIPSTGGKWIELLKSIAPAITRVAYLFNPDTVPLLYARSVETAAPLLSVKPLAAAVHNAHRVGRRDRADCARIRQRASGAARPFHRNELSVGHRAYCSIPLARDLSVPLLRRERRSDVLWD